MHGPDVSPLGGQSIRGCEGAFLHKFQKSDFWSNNGIGITSGNELYPVDFVKHNVDVFAQVFRKWDMRNDNLAITSRIVRRFKNQQRHFIHFAELCHLTRLLRKASIGRSNFCLSYVIRGLEATEVNQCLSRNCIDFFLLALNCWKSELCAIRALSMSCWRHSARQMSTGHFVKLATLIMIVLARILCERSQNDSYATTPKSCSTGSTPHDRMSRELNFISGQNVDKPSIGQTPIMNSRRNSQKDRKELLKLLRGSKDKRSKNLDFLGMLFK
ncbi:hypothetical protein TSMEX_010250 [Taenia solium]|eukprot:TsM_000167800 transcript=TsM_000167800 gene=TsM_000167800